MQRTIRLREHATTDGLSLSADEIKVLQTAKVAVAPTPEEPERWSVRPGSTVGLIQSGDLTLEIRPKMSIERVLFLASFALDPDAFGLGSPGMVDAPTLHEALVPAFTQHVRNAIRPGVLQGYRSYDEALRTVRGRIRVGDQVSRRFGLVPPVEVTFDEFTEDIEENRLIKSALRRLGKLPMRSAELRRHLTVLEPSFATVTPIDYRSRTLPDIHWTRLNDRYRPAVSIAKLILSGVSIESLTGATTASGFLLDMNKVFEDFVVVALREALGLDARRFPQGDGRLRLDTAGRVRLRPDLSWWRTGKCIFVGDAKYKRISVEGILHPDLYQLLAYTVAAELPEGLLIYAAGEADDVIHEIRYAGKRLRVVTLDLAGSIDQLLGEISDLAMTVKALAV